MNGDAHSTPPYPPGTASAASSQNQSPAATPAADDSDVNITAAGTPNPDSILEDATVCKGKEREDVGLADMGEDGNEDEEDDLENPGGEEDGDTAEILANKTRRDAQSIKRERNLAELLLMMDEYQPIIPDSVTDYYLARSGFECDDLRIKRLLGLAAQKFIADVAGDALQYCKIRGQGAQAKDRRGASKDKRTVLTMDDLSAALAEHGVNIKKPEMWLG
ncbi:Transcription initiation factor TFIID subunit 10 [Borealophlyctis nickersoniae]|nr:Transcription initiation factor TFIID subunit 10 [Borealophlyctis nickersoniae]